jgi:hypothetical protein
MELRNRECVPDDVRIETGSSSGRCIVTIVVRESRLSHAIWLLGLQLMLTLGLSWLMRIAPLSTAGCSSLCDYETLAVAMNTFYVIAVTLLVLAVAGTVLLRNRGWWVIAPPVTAIVVLTASWFITTAVANVAMRIS